MKEKGKGPSSRILLDHRRESPLKQEFIEFMRERVVGQTRIIEKVAEAIEGISLGLREPNQPVASFLILGPSRVGKTLTAESTAEFLFGSPDALTRINCQDYSESHRIADILGSPKGYVGYDDEPLLTQSRLDRFAMKADVRHTARGLYGKDLEQFLELRQKFLKKRSVLEKYRKTPKEKRSDDLDEILRQDWIDSWNELHAVPTLLYHPKNGYCSVVLFDEIERSHKAFQNILLTILDKGFLNLSPKEKGADSDGDSMVRFSNSLIFATSNLGDDEIEKLIKVQTGGRVPMGFTSTLNIKEEDYDQQIYRICREEARKQLHGPLVNRFSAVLAARPLTKKEFGEILDLQIKQLQARLLKQWELPILLKISRRAKRFILDQATDNPSEQAALIKKKLNHHITSNLSRLKLTNQIQEGDVVEVLFKRKGKKGELLFFRLPNGAKEKKALVFSLL